MGNLLGRLGDANGAAGTLAGASIGAGALTTDREALAVADTTVAVDGLQALQIASEFTTEVTFNDPLVLSDDVENLVELLLGQVLSAHVRIKANLGDNLIGAAGADTVNVTEGERDFLLRGDFNTEETWHGG
jgi:hypothetical protein